jgi:integrase
MSPRNLSRSLSSLLAKAGLPARSLHALRHTALSLLVASGVHMKTVQTVAGHSSYKLTADTYSHVLPEQQREAIDTLDRLYNQS